MDRSFRYLARLIVGPLVMITLAIGAIVWLSQSLRFVDLVLNRGLPVYYLLWMALLIMPMILPVLLPVALFIAVVFTYTKLTMDSELVVLRAAGMSDGKLGKPAIAIAVLIMGICYAINLYFMPVAYRDFKDLQYQIRSDYSSVLLQEGVFNQLAPGITVYVAERKPDGELVGILAHDTRVPDKPVTMIAERGALVRSADGSSRVLMINGNRQMVERNRDQLSLLYFDRYTLDLGTAQQDSGSRWHDAQERFLGELFSPGTTGPDLRNAARFRADGHQRLASPLLAIAFALIGLAGLLSGELDRRGQSRRVVVSVGIVVAIQVADLGIVNLAAIVPAAVPLIYLLPIGTIVGAGWFLFRQRLPYAAPAPAASLAS